MTDITPRRVGVLFGGKSGEHEVSLMSARTVLSALDQAGYETIPIGISPEGRWLSSGDPMLRLSSGSGSISPTNGEGQQAQLSQTLVDVEERLPAFDIIFPVLHGPLGEDGTVQGLLEMADIPYVGCGVLASATGMDKVTCKMLLRAAGLPTVDSVDLTRNEWRRAPEGVLKKIQNRLAFPLFVKPANLGSSVGISKVSQREELIGALDLAAQFDRRILVETGVVDAREIEVSVLGNDEPEASVVGEIVPANEFYDYDAKYENAGSRMLIPAPIPSEIAQRVQNLAIQVFRLLDCAGLARVDFLLDSSGALFINEINTMPGFTHASMYPKLWEASGLSLPALVEKLVELAIERHLDRCQNQTRRSPIQ